MACGGDGTLAGVPRLEIKRQMGRGDIAAVSELLEVAGEVDGHPALGEHQWLDLVAGGREGFAGLVAWEPGHSHPVGYAQLTHETRRRSWALELVVDPHHRDRHPDIGPRLGAAALAIVRAEGGGHVQLWIPRPTPAHDALAADLGLARDRDLLQLRRPLPYPAEEPSLAVRPFVPGRDDGAWLAMNARAFAAHGEQGAWTAETLADRLTQPWFDADGFLLHERQGRLAGFCWTKVHPDRHPPLGELYVVAVDPDFQGHGLGRALAATGLAHLGDRGLPVAMLYVDAANGPAVGLYRSMGFAVDHLDRSYTAEVVPSQPRAPAPTPTTEPMP